MKKKGERKIGFSALAAALLLLFSILLLFGCTGTGAGSQTGGDNTGGDSSGQNGEATPPKSHEDWQETIFFHEESGVSFSFYLPWEWEIWCSRGYAILYEDGEEVGRIGNYYSNGQTSDYENSVRDGFVLEKMEYLNENEGRFIVTLFKNEGQEEIYLAIDLKASALSESDKAMLFENVGVAGPSFLDMFSGGMEESGEILILGNSFIGTSRVGAFLSALFEAGEKNYTVNAISKGYASVSRYANESWYGPDLMNEIRSGKYAAVFLCGFYSEADVEALPIIRDICLEGETPLMLFPAHNESSALWNRAVKETNLPVLPWQTEINALINEGLASFSDFCIDDSHFHSTPLAGYVGASMIYRAVCGELPERVFWDAPLDVSAVSDKLGAYMYRGNAGGVSDLPLYVLKKTD